MEKSARQHAEALELLCLAHPQIEAATRLFRDSAFGRVPPERGPTLRPKTRARTRVSTPMPTNGLRLPELGQCPGVLEIDLPLFGPHQGVELGVEPIHQFLVLGEGLRIDAAAMIEALEHPLGALHHRPRQGHCGLEELSLLLFSRRVDPGDLAEALCVDLELRNQAPELRLLAGVFRREIGERLLDGLLQPGIDLVDGLQRRHVKVVVRVQSVFDARRGIDAPQDGHRADGCERDQHDAADVLVRQTQARKPHPIGSPLAPPHRRLHRQT